MGITRIIALPNTIISKPNKAKPEAAPYKLLFQLIDAPIANTMVKASTHSTRDAKKAGKKIDQFTTIPSLKTYLNCIDIILPSIYTITLSIQFVNVPLKAH